jgi:uncharacterized membrane protein
MLKKYPFILIILLICLISLGDLFRSGLPLSHDGQDHVARIANFYQNLSEGNLIPRWAPYLNWGYGHPILMFLYPLPSYLASFFHFIGFNFVDSLKIVFGLTFIASGLAMYIWLSEFLGKQSAFFGALLYMFAPYRFVDLYVRGAIGEHVAFVFLPLVLYFMLKMSKRSNFLYIVGGAFSLSGLILSHNAITLMFLPIIFGYGAYLFTIQNGSNKFLGRLGVLGLLGFGVSAFFWMPAFFEGKYTLRDIVTGGGEYKTRFVGLKEFFIGSWSFGGTTSLSKQIGLIHWIGILFSTFAFFKLYKYGNKLWLLTLGSMLVFFISLFIMTSYSGFVWEKISILQKFQFPWRFLSITVFLAALLGAISFDSVLGRYKKIVLLVLVVGLLLANKNYWHANGFLQKPESFFTNTYYGTTDTGESAPIWSVRFMEKPAKENIEVISGKARIEELRRISTVHSYNIEVDERSRIRENTLYFPGWNIYVNGKKTDIEFQDPANRGLMTFYVEKGKHNAVVKFEETRFRLFANLISFLSLLFLIILGIFNRIKIWQRFL